MDFPIVINWMSQLFESCGIVHIDTNLLLHAKHDEEFKDGRNVILSELETFVAGTKRFPTPSLN